MTTWFTADLHLGHRNIIRYCDRRFESVGVMNRALIARWNEIDDDDDTVRVLGDFALGTIADTLPRAGELRPSGGAARSLLLVLESIGLVVDEVLAPPVAVEDGRDDLAGDVVKRLAREDFRSRRTGLRRPRPSCR